MALTTRERNIRRIFVVFAVICFVLAGYLFVEAWQLERQLEALTSPGQAIARNPQVLRKQLRRIWPLAWATLGAGMLLTASALMVGRGRATPTA